MKNKHNFEVKIVFDNNALPGFQSGWGFGAIIMNNYSNNILLFDTGAGFPKLAHNLNKFNIKVEGIKKVIISHTHMDHAGGLMSLVTINPKIELYLAYSKKNYMSNQMPSDVKVYGIKDITEIEDNIYCSKELGTGIPEISLFLKSEKGIVIITGCAHPGLENIIENAKELGKIRAVLGGFHGFDKLYALEGIDLIAPCHCTSKTNKIRRNFPNNFVEIKAGSTLIF
ncbi:MAG: MBL fold metallo-hydrolase [Candidatus Lokiarchaeota archaeon]|nr:MBL fold metallo-hydrolase [Candidatus Lokiarchaeota archaeon]